jgi:ADP-ribose pyrophosphatase YjhB (NUDIX family)
MNKKINTVDIIVVIDRKKIVLIERTKPPFMDKLVLPGGKMDHEGESPRQACAREALEEINLEVNPKDLLFLTTLDNKDPRPFIGISFVYAFFLNDKRKIKKLAAKSDAKEIVIKNIKSIKEKDIGFKHYDAIKLLKQNTRQ